MSLQTAEVSFPMAEDDLGDLSLDQLFSPKELGKDAAIAGAEWAIGHRGYVCGAVLGLSLGWARGASASDVSMGGNTESTPPEDWQDFVNVGLKTAQRVAVPVIIGLGNGARVWSMRQGEKRGLVQDMTAMSKEIKELSQLTETHILEMAKQQGMSFRGAEERQFVDVQMKNFKKREAGLIEVLKASHKKLSPFGKYGLVQIALETGSEFIQGTLFGAVISSALGVLGGIWNQASSAETVPDMAEKWLEFAGWIAASGALFKLMWDTQNPGGSAAARKSEAEEVLRKEGLV